MSERDTLAALESPQSIRNRFRDEIREALADEDDAYRSDVLDLIGPDEEEPRLIAAGVTVSQPETPGLREDGTPPFHLDALLPHRTFSLRVKADHDWLADYFSGYHGVPGLRAALAATPAPEGLDGASLTRAMLAHLEHTDPHSLGPGCGDAIAREFAALGESS